MKTHILLIEDNPPDVMILKMALDKAGANYEISTIADGAEAVDFVRRQDAGASAPKPDVILLDLNIPKKDGREVLREIRGSAALKAVPVVILSGAQSPRDTEELLRLSPAALLAKPLDFDGVLQLGRTIKGFLEGGLHNAMSAKN